MCKATGLVYAVSSSAPTDALRQQNCAMQQTTCLKGGPPAANCTAIHLGLPRDGEGSSTAALLT